MRSIFLSLPLPLLQAPSAALASSILSLEKAVLLGDGSAEMTASPSPAHTPVTPSRLAAAGCLSASRSVLRHAEALVPQLPGKAMCPWHLVALQQAQHSVRLYLQTVAGKTASSAPVNQSGTDPHPILNPSQATALQPRTLTLAAAAAAESLAFPPQVIHLTVTHSIESTPRFTGSGRRKASRVLGVLRRFASRAARCLGITGLSVVVGGGKVLLGAARGTKIFGHQSAMSLVCASRQIVSSSLRAIVGTARSLWGAASVAAFGLYITLVSTGESVVLCFTQGASLGLRSLGKGLVVGSGMILVGLATGVSGLLEATGEGIRGVGSGTRLLLGGFGGAAVSGLRIFVMEGAEGFLHTAIGFVHGPMALAERVHLVNNLEARHMREPDWEESSTAIARIPETQPLTLPNPSNPTFEPRSSTATPKSSMLSPVPRPDELDLLSMEAALAILTLAPPASESQCLAALFQALQGSRAFPLLVQLAMSSLSDDLPATQPALAAAAAAVTVLDLTLAFPLSSEVPYPCPCTSLKDNEEIMQVGAELLDSYAASWLSLVSMTRLNRRKPNQNDKPGSASWMHASSTSTASGSLLEHPFWDGGGSSAASSSRLPLPPAWLLMEAHQLPGPIGRRDQSSSSGGLKERFSSAGMCHASIADEGLGHVRINGC